jgi:mono/diheme cytochrome c family protein
MSNEIQTPPEQSKEKLTHVLAEYETPGALIRAAEKVRDAGYSKWDCHSPFPVHGIDPAMGIKMTRLPLLVFGAGAFGCLFAVFFQYYLNAEVVPTLGRFSGWEWTVSGKPFWSSPANIPITFEITVLLAALTTFFAMWGMNRLPQVWHPLFSSDNFLRATDDSFFIAIESGDPKFNQTKTVAFLEEIGALRVEPITIVTGAAERKIPKMVLAFILVTTVMALVPFAFLAKARADTSAKPHVHVIPNMDFQQKVRAQEEFAPFADERGSQPWPAGTVARGPGALAADDHFYRGLADKQWAQAFPDQVTPDMAFMRRGQDRFNIYCAPCHGASADGNGAVAVRALALGEDAKGYVQPTNLVVPEMVRLPHGQIFNTISNGIRTMPGYRAQLPEADRWAIIFYLRALQRAECDARANLPDHLQQKIKGSGSTVEPATPADSNNAPADNNDAQ